MAQKFNTEFNYRYQVIGNTPWERIKTLKGFLEGRIRALAGEEIDKLRRKATLSKLNHLKNGGEGLEHEILELEADILEAKSHDVTLKEAFELTKDEIKILKKLIKELYVVAEPIRIEGYTEDEKLNIADQYLVKKQIEANGLKKGEIKITKSAILSIIRHYTREAGVRNLEREIAKIARKVVKSLVLKAVKKTTHIRPSGLDKYLGVRKFKYGIAEKENQVGQVTGLAWTQVGGELLTIESMAIPGKGKLINTGQLGDVMKESIQAATTIVRSRAKSLGIDEEFHQKLDLHVHVPEGATPKDGPSAGVGMTTALVSALTQIPVKANVAMTGEITLRGEVLSIGGLKEKLLAAHRGGIATVIIPEENSKDLVEIPKNIKEKLNIIPVKWIDQVLEIALEKMPDVTPKEPETGTVETPPVSEKSPLETNLPH